MNARIIALCISGSPHHCLEHCCTNLVLQKLVIFRAVG